MKLTNFLINKNSSCVPIWFMRQAGRYLPEFREIRSKNPDFIKLCLNSKLSAKITMQPINRFNLDAAIIFSDILMTPYALGQDVNFIKNKGPVLSNFNMDIFLNNKIENFTNKLIPVYDAIKETRTKLNKEKSLISFVGSPWTLIIYMLKINKENNTLDKEIFSKKKAEFDLIFEKLNLFLCAHIKNQINAGADVVQIFDSWAGLIPKEYLYDYCYKPNKKLVDFCKNNKVSVICFPKGIKDNYSHFLDVVKPDCLSIDYDIDPEWARTNLSNVCIQGGMNPNVLLLNEKIIYNEAEKYLKIFNKYPYIFNLGHGLLPETDPDKLEKLIRFVREYN